MSAAPIRSPAPPAPGETVPPLENGDRLTRREFERRYARMPHLNKAELIDGVVYMPSPVRFRKHGQPHLLMNTWLGYYLSKTPGLIAGDNVTVRLDNKNAPQPDVLLCVPSHAGGTSTIDEDDYLSGGPDFVGEVASSSASIDLHAKLQAYQRNGVREYLVWRVADGAIDYFVLKGGRFEPLPADGSGVVRSSVFPGLWLDVTAIMAGDLQKVFSAVDQGAATPAHAEFVARLRPPEPHQA